MDVKVAERLAEAKIGNSWTCNHGNVAIAIGVESGSYIPEYSRTLYVHGCSTETLSYRARGYGGCWGTCRWRDGGEGGGWKTTVGVWLSASARLASRVLSLWVHCGGPVVAGPAVWPSRTICLA